MSRRIWEAVEAKVEKVRIVETEGGKKEVRRKRERKIEKEEDKGRWYSRNKESGKRVGDIE